MNIEYIISIIYIILNMKYLKWGWGQTLHEPYRHLQLRLAWLCACLLIGQLNPHDPNTLLWALQQPKTKHQVVNPSHCYGQPRKGSQSVEDNDGTKNDIYIYSMNTSLCKYLKTQRTLALLEICTSIYYIQSRRFHVHGKRLREKWLNTSSINPPCHNEENNPFDY